MTFAMAAWHEVQADAVCRSPARFPADMMSFYLLREHMLVMSTQCCIVVQEKKASTLFVVVLVSGLVKWLMEPGRMLPFVDVRACDSLSKEVARELGVFALEV